MERKWQKIFEKPFFYNGGGLFPYLSLQNDAKELEIPGLYTSWVSDQQVGESYETTQVLIIKNTVRPCNYDNSRQCALFSICTI